MADLLIITNSYDATTDLLLDYLQGESVFRFNFDRTDQYRVQIDGSGFLLVDELGRSVGSQSVGKAYWRKPFNAGSGIGNICPKYVDAEMRYALTEIVNLLWLERKLILVEPYAERRTGKLVQLRYAKTYFHVPGYEFIVNRQPTYKAGVVKSLSNELVEGDVLFTTRVETASLATRYPWFVQQEITAAKDVTVVFVRGRLFAFSLERDFLDRSVDWRQVAAPEQKWRSHALPSRLEAAIRGYMAALRLDYGRLDFLLDGKQRYWFCEVNPNGQFAWLDLENEYDLLSCVATEISPSTPVYALANPHPLSDVVLREPAVTR